MDQTHVYVLLRTDLCLLDFIALILAKPDGLAVVSRSTILLKYLNRKQIIPKIFTKWLTQTHTKVRRPLNQSQDGGKVPEVLSAHVK